MNFDREARSMDRLMETVRRGMFDLNAIMKYSLEQELPLGERLRAFEAVEPKSSN